MLKNFVINVFAIILITKVGFGILKFLFSSKTRRRSAVFYRIKKIISNAVCKPLDKIIEKQEIQANPKIIKMPKRVSRSGG